jgi:hypothetical protein
MEEVQEIPCYCEHKILRQNKSDIFKILKINLDNPEKEVI